MALHHLPGALIHLRGLKKVTLPRESLPRAPDDSLLVLRSRAAVQKSHLGRNRGFLLPSASPWCASHACPVPGPGAQGCPTQAPALPRGAGSALPTL